MLLAEPCACQGGAVARARGDEELVTVADHRMPVHPHDEAGKRRRRRRCAAGEDVIGVGSVGVVGVDLGDQ
ncbi:hypothetical protein [Streptomyces thermovulgaris]|uniref:hypothetical protein n=1 Tax=Streptomyces thermovulgaris TaxID=1934 RepID=UPI001FE805C4|nr:hypothetical protein [Streptomyces thermovulgaris]